MVPVVVFSVAHSQDIYNKSVSYTIVLKSLQDNRVLPMVIGLSEAEAIIVEINGTKTKFPLSHDLVKNTLSIMDAEIKKVVVTELKNEIYYAVISLTYKGENYEIDSRPSDAIALALRFNAPIYVSNEVMNSASYPIEDNFLKDEKTKTKSQIEILKEKLDKAVKKEQYEEAAQLRDEIKKIEQEQANK
jgi:uncharacterized protein